jgi:hypothetical protein
MHVTERGRVVYNRKKHVFKTKDLERITRKLAELEKPTTIWTAIKNTFRELWSVTSMTLPEAIEWVDLQADTMVEFVDLVVMVSGLKASTIAGYPIPAGPGGSTLRRYAVAICRETADTIEERGN